MYDDPNIDVQLRNIVHESEREEFVESVVDVSDESVGPYVLYMDRCTTLHPEKLSSVFDRCVRQCERVLGILDGALGDRKWLVGDKLCGIRREKRCCQGFPNGLGMNVWGKERR
ncbi:hypothetical protein EYC80_009031 [Monilinia laxa]|uniref:Uncharacterized protein n=1 Tax=Monilinia laxa TaxID=61186 RepID=A0A5N6K263_MONLA|nr:hypothetical protein EYC80_009031 [Monilinia laxa]